MPLPNLIVPDFPNVPPLPGVPQLPRAPGESLASFAISTVLADAVGLLQELLAPIWGIYDDQGAPIAVTDTVLTLEYRGDSRISSYPQEEGAFASFNKVQMPYDARIQLVSSKSSIERAAFLAAIEAAKQSTMLFSIVTPDATYENANVVGYNYRRTARNGVTMLVVELYIEEVRETGTAQFANTQNPSSQDAANLGQVQGQPPTAGESALFGPVSVTTGVGGVL
ncbi:hypothetical protein BLA13014_04080 [Burkholderia aenigmatica]|uniref:Dit-like phage tail protein N-terminal domain-containing protein n=1 Tax=Burkholderia aenigmatica TaxID=2015348 RepID=A0A6P2N5Z7_9BURK|nr:MULTISPECIES: hypothetical protein [Burkholderia]VWB88166.1 hypothetical protein BLA13014_04080 [Burkholderia aenigmatica]